jgi:flagellin
MIINHNMSSINASRTLKVRNNNLQESMSKLSSGLRINKAGDDASGLAVSEKMRSQIAGLKQASANAENAMSFIQTTEGYLAETQEILTRIRELSIQSANGIYSNEDRMMIKVEVSQMVQEISRVANDAQFNGMNMLTGAFSRQSAESAPTNSMWFHIGANQGQRIQAYVGNMSATGLNLKMGDTVAISDPASADRTIGTIDGAISIVTKQRADLGAYQNRISKLIKGIDIAHENLVAAESRIRDTNIAEEMVSYARDQILIQSNMSMLAQANSKNNAILKLIG